MDIIKAADILLPDAADMSRWSVIACDQFTSDRAYWDDTRRLVGDAPSTLNMILPEALMGTAEAAHAREDIAGYMQRCLDGVFFRQLKDSFIYVERRFDGGSVRHGIVAAVDLEEYEYKPENDAAIKATEHTVEERLYKRIELRETAPLELPHVIIFYNDPEDRIAGKLRDEKAELIREYDFELMQGGGHISGWSVSGEKAEELEAALNALTVSESDGATLAVADGNHSLATAKLCWERAKAGLTDEQKKIHRARYALAELVNIYDSSIRIEPIHRVIAGTDVSGFTSFVEERFLRAGKEGKSVKIKAGTADGEREMRVSGLSVGQIIDAADKMIAEYLAEHGGSVDYIHDDASAAEMGSRAGCAYLMLPAVEKKEIFEMVKRKELFPKKSFSIGSAREKRYYLECRRIK